MVNPVISNYSHESNLPANPVISNDDHDHHLPANEAVANVHHGGQLPADLNVVYELALMSARPDIFTPA